MPTNSLHACPLSLHIVLRLNTFLSPRKEGVIFFFFGVKKHCRKMFLAESCWKLIFYWVLILKISSLIIFKNEKHFSLFLVLFLRRFGLGLNNNQINRRTKFC